MKGLFRARSRRLILAFSLAGVFAVSSLYPANAQAQTQTTCFQNYFNCLDRASQLSGFWARTAAGADCYVTFTACIYHAFHP